LSNSDARNLAVGCFVAEVAVDWLKWPADPYRTTPMHRLGADAQGTWLFAPRGAAASYSQTGPAPLPVNFLTLVPSTTGWIATWMWGNPAIDIDVYVDVIDFPTWVSETELRVVDLDLDVIRIRSGQVVLDDEDEFVENIAARRYPADVVETARATADELVEAVEQRRAPFGDQSLRWRDIAASRSDYQS
jgi:hypothetical protein